MLQEGDLIKVKNLTDFDRFRGLEDGMILEVENDSKKDLQGIFVINPYDPQFLGVPTINYLYKWQFEPFMEKRNENDFKEYKEEFLKCS